MCSLAVSILKSTNSVYVAVVTVPVLQFVTVYSSFELLMPVGRNSTESGCTVITPQMIIAVLDKPWYLHTLDNINIDAQFYS